MRTCIADPPLYPSTVDLSSAERASSKGSGWGACEAACDERPSLSLSSPPPLRQHCSECLDSPCSSFSHSPLPPRRPLCRAPSPSLSQPTAPRQTALSASCDLSAFQRPPTYRQGFSAATSRSPFSCPTAQGREGGAYRRAHARLVRRFARSLDPGADLSHEQSESQRSIPPALTAPKLESMSSKSTPLTAYLPLVEIVDHHLPFKAASHRSPSSESFSLQPFAELDLTARLAGCPLPLCPEEAARVHLTL